MRNSFRVSAHAHTHTITHTQSHTHTHTQSQPPRPLINQILLSCKFQSDRAQLDIRLIFSWYSGIEYQIKNNTTKKKHYFDSEALTYELVLAIATYALSESNVGCDACQSGKFPEASRHFTKTASIFRLLGNDIVPNWMANSKQYAEMESDCLAETRVGVCVAFTSLYEAMSQQMAVAVILAKPGIPNYVLVGKLCLGIAEELDTFVSTMRSKSPVQMSRLEPSFLTMITFAINIQRAASLYFLARSLWTESDYGVAISALSEATVAMRTRSSINGRGLPKIDPNGPLKLLFMESNKFRQHMTDLLSAWEKDNQLVYFEKVPPSVPANKGLKAIQLKKSDQYILEIRDIVPLGTLPDEETSSMNSSMIAASDASHFCRDDGPPSYDAAISGLQRSDSELARELQEKWNTE